MYWWTYTNTSRFPNRFPTPPRFLRYKLLRQPSPESVEGSTVLPPPPRSNDSGEREGTGPVNYLVQITWCRTPETFSSFDPPGRSPWAVVPANEGGGGILNCAFAGLVRPPAPASALPQ